MKSGAERERDRDRQKHGERQRQLQTYINRKREIESYLYSEEKERQIKREDGGLPDNAEYDEDGAEDSQQNHGHVEDHQQAQQVGGQGQGQVGWQHRRPGQVEGWRQDGWGHATRELRAQGERQVVEEKGWWRAIS